MYLHLPVVWCISKTGGRVNPSVGVARCPAISKDKKKVLPNHIAFWILMSATLGLA